MISAQDQKFEVMLAPQDVTDAATANANIDTKDADYATIHLNLAQPTTDTATHTISLLESDDTVVTNFSTVTADLTPDLQASKQIIYHVDLRNRKRYLRVSVTAGSGTGSDIIASATGILSRLDECPENTSEMVASTNDVVTIIPA